MNTQSTRNVLAAMGLGLAMLTVLLVPGCTEKKDKASEKDSGTTREKGKVSEKDSGAFPPWKGKVWGKVKVGDKTVKFGVVIFINA